MTTHHRRDQGRSAAHVDGGLADALVEGARGCARGALISGHAWL